MDKKGWRPRGGKCRSDLACNMARLADSAHDDAAPTVELSLTGASKIFAQSRDQRSNTLGLEL